MRAPLWRTTPPEVPIGDHCCKPNECPFIPHCHPPGPEYPVTDLYKATRRLKDRLAADGIMSIQDIPPGYDGLSELNQRIREAVVNGTPFVDPAVHEALAKCKFPLFFLDFETINPAIPLYVGTRPYDQIPFQWSIHRMERDGSLTHGEFLHENLDDPRRPLLESMLRTLGTDGDILVYSPFEATQLRAMREAYPEFAQPIEDVIARLVDMLPPIREHVYHPEFHGSFSIKSVLPALVPAMGYDDLKITDGSSATAAFVTMMKPETPESVGAALRAELLRYCRRDTEAMVELWRRLR